MFYLSVDAEEKGGKQQGEKIGKTFQKENGTDSHAQFQLKLGAKTQAWLISRLSFLFPPHLRYDT
jgi:hypothetical protein